MKVYKTKIINKSERSLQLPESIDGSGFRYDIAHKKTIEIENTDPRNYLSPFEKIVVTGMDELMLEKQAIILGTVDA